MAVIGSAEIVVTANTQGFDRALNQSGGLVGKFTGAIKGLDASLGKFGLTTRDLSVILGAGLAGGIAFAGKAIIDFGTASVQAAAKLEDARNLTERVFDDQSEAVEEFAERASVSIGLSERAALAAVASFGLFAKNLGLPTEAAANLGTSLTRLASDIASSQADFVKIEDVLVALRAALRGERDPLERFGVTLTDASIKAQAVKLGIAEVGDELTSTQKVIASYADILEKTNLIQGDFADTQESLPNTMNTFTAAVEELQASLGAGLVPLVTDAVKDFTVLLRVITDLADGTSDLAKNADKYLGPLDEILGFVRKVASYGNPLQNLRRVLDFLGDKQTDLGEGTDELTSAQDLAAQSTDALTKAEEKNESQVNKLTDARKRLNRALEDSERRVDRAEESLDRALEDSELRIDKAERKIAEAFVDRADKIADAEQNLAEQRLQGFRDVRAARERLVDFERDAARRLADAEREVVDARRQRTRAITDAQIALERAQASGDAEAQNEARRQLSQAQQDRSVADAERTLAQEKSDQTREQARLERDLAEARLDAAKRVAEAQKDLARTFRDTAKVIAEAQRDLEDAQRQSARQIADAQRNLADAAREGAEAVGDAQLAMDRLADDAERAAKAVRQMKNDLDSLGLGILGAEGGTISPFAGGGTFQSGQTMLVGEQGPELITATRPGQVTSSDDLMRMLRELLGQGGSSRGGVNIYTGNTDPRVLANELAWRLVQDVNR